MPKTEPHSYTTLARVGRLLDRARAQLASAMDAEMAPFGLTGAQWTVVSAVASGRADSAMQICHELSYDPGAMTRMIDRLAEKGILHRVTNREDRRAWRIMLTEHGRKIYPDLLGSSERVLTRLFGSFTADELGQLEEHLARIHAAEPAAGA